ncbi:MAG: hypothetical protein H0W11_14320 [Gemmatimonadetes bacterium]|jgi:hypothetical protein|nr:hypothetical protein [Gemmatimonadota bacterium]
MNELFAPGVIDTILKALAPLAAGIGWLYYQLTFGRRSRLKDDLDILERCQRLGLAADSIAALKEKAEEQIARSTGRSPSVKTSDLVMGIGGFALAGLLWATSDITATGWRLFGFILLALIGLGGFSNAVNPSRKR